MNLKKFIIQKYDNNLINEFKRLGIEDEEILKIYIKESHNGNLAKFLNQNDKIFTFGILHAIFLDAIEAKRKTDLKIGIIKAIHRTIPVLLAPFFPTIAIIGVLFSTTRTFNKIISPILKDPGHDYPGFLTKVIKSSMKVAEGEINVKDRFARAFVVSDNITKALKEDVLRQFSLYLADKMSKENPTDEVPDNYIENELKTYLNDQFDIDPEIPLKK